MAKADWFDFSDAARRIETAERAMREPDLDQIADGFWGINGIGVICHGGYQLMRMVAEKRRSDMLSSGAKRTVADRLPIWC